jgi:hypothetical protein
MPAPRAIVLGLLLGCLPLPVLAQPARPGPIDPHGESLLLRLPGMGTDPEAIDYAGLPPLEARHAVICPPDPAWTTSEDGRVFTRLALLSIPSARPATLQYAHAIERDGHLFIAFSRNKATIEVLRLPLSDLDLLRGK